MTPKSQLILDVINQCVHYQPYPIFDETGNESLPCGETYCHTSDGKAYHPRRRTCAQCGKQFRSACPAALFCCEDCFIASQTEAEWKGAIPTVSIGRAKLASEEEKTRRKNTRNKYLNSPKGKKTKSEQNRREYVKRKASGKVRRAVRRNDTSPKPEGGESSEGGLRAK